MNIRKYIPFRLWNFWPLFLFTGIKILKVSKDYRHILIRLKLNIWNRNYVGTQFGGAMFTVTDAFYMIMLIKNLGPNYIVWDKEAHIQFLKPGKTALTAEFILTEEELQTIREQVEQHGKTHFVKTVELKDTQGQVIAKADRTMHIKKKDFKKSP